MNPQARRGSILRRRWTQRNEGGYVLALTAMVIVPLLVISAMAVDFGGWFAQGTRMQRAADAAALAGVVWLPDMAEATSVAKKTAKANGYDDALSNITVTVSRVNEYELKVDINDSEGRVYLASWIRNNVSITRSATAKYVLPVPLGSPRNFFGTGNMYAANPENFFAAINGTCQSKYQGDPFAVPRISSNNNACANNATYTANGDYKDPATTDQYEYYITVPEGRTQPILVSLWNPGGNETYTVTGTPSSSTKTITVNNVSKGVQAQPATSCSGGPNYSCTTSFSVRAKATSTPSLSCMGSGPYTCTLSFNGSPSSSFSITSNSGRPTRGGCSYTGNGSNRYYTCPISVPTSVTADATPAWACTLAADKYTCTLSSTYTPTSTYTVNDPAGGSGVPATTFSLYAADATPLDDADNTLLNVSGSCAPGDATYPNPRTFTNATTGTRTILGQAGWTDLCVIPTGTPAGKYRLTLRNSAVDGATGLNGYGVMASYLNNVGAACDSRTDAMCPKVAGKNWISIYANYAGSVGSFFLAEIDRAYAGKTVVITLFDPGEGGNYIEILDPNGNPVSFVARDMGIDGVTPSSPLPANTRLDVTQARYNGHYVQLEIDLPGSYGTSLTQYWWKIRYTFLSNTSVTDRTTWGVRVLGNPVHLTS